MMSMERLLITGASGFIGSHLVRQALAAGYEVWAAVRRDSDKARLTAQELLSGTMSSTMLVSRRPPMWRSSQR